MVLCLLFGVMSSVCSLFLRFGRRCLLQMLHADCEAQIRLPSSQEIQVFQSVISAQYSLFPDVYCVADGVKLFLEQCGDTVIENMFYNGWVHDHCISNVLVFAPNGCIIACAINAPGAMHDSTIAEWGGVYGKAQTIFGRCRGRFVVDSAFSNGKYPFLIKSVQDDVTRSESPADIIQMRQATSVRQSAEWGMRAFQGSFPRMKDRFVYEINGERKRIILSTIMLYNLRARMVGLNQLQTTFMPTLSVEANMFLYDELHL